MLSLRPNAQKAPNYHRMCFIVNCLKRLKGSQEWLNRQQKLDPYVEKARIYNYRQVPTAHFTYPRYILCTSTYLPRYLDNKLQEDKGQEDKAKLFISTPLWSVCTNMRAASTAVTLTIHSYRQGYRNSMQMK